MIHDQEAGQILIENVGAILSIMRDKRTFKREQEIQHVKNKKRDCILMRAALIKLVKDRFIDQCDSVEYTKFALESGGPELGLTDTPEYIKWFEVQEMKGHFNKYPLYRLREIVFGEDTPKKVTAGDSFTVLYDQIEGSHYRAVEAIAMNPPRLLETIEEGIDNTLKNLNLKIDMKADELSCNGGITEVVVRFGAELLKKKIDNLFYRLPRRYNR
jgi:hypothetical protein